MGTKTETIQAETTETAPVRKKVKRYRLKAQFVAETREAFKRGTTVVKIYGSNFGVALHNYEYDQLLLSIGFGSANHNPYSGWKIEMFKRGYKKALAQLSEEQVAKINEQYRRARLSREMRKLEDVEKTVNKLNAQVEHLNEQLAARGLVEAED